MGEPAFITEELCLVFGGIFILRKGKEKRMNKEILAFIITSGIIIYIINTLIGISVVRSGDPGFVINEWTDDIAKNKLLFILFFIFPVYVITYFIFAILFVGLFTCIVWVPIVLYNLIIYLL